MNLVDSQLILWLEALSIGFGTIIFAFFITWYGLTGKFKEHWDKVFKRKSR